MLCTTTSAPSFAGERIIGAKVLSTTTLTPFACAILLNSGMFATIKLGSRWIQSTTHWSFLRSLHYQPPRDQQCPQTLLLCCISVVRNGLTWREFHHREPSLPPHAHQCCKAAVTLMISQTYVQTKSQ